MTTDKDNILLTNLKNRYEKETGKQVRFFKIDDLAYCDVEFICWAVNEYEEMKEKLKEVAG
jgi:hypothetical protein